MQQKTKRTVAVSIGAVVFSAAYLAPPGLLPFAELQPMLVVVGIAAPAGTAFVLWQWFDYVATRHDVRIVRQVEPEREPKAAMR